MVEGGGAKLMEDLLYLVKIGWRSIMGRFDQDTYNTLSEFCMIKCPALNQNTIECKVRSLKKQYNAISEMLSQSGFDWNEEFKCVQVEREIFNLWVRSHPNAKGMWNKPFPHYDDLSTDCHTPEVCQIESLLNQDEIDEEPTEQSTGRTSIPVESSRGSKRKRSSFQVEMIDIMRSTVEMHSTHMGRLASWQKKKYELEFGRQKEVVNAIYNIDGLDEDTQVTLIDLVVTDIQKTDCFLAVPEHAWKRYCLRLLGRNM
ncbi:uncharacterized protein LOC120069696 [Benincasa hispida]|uniref:uncharacterized protein LOC120069696 n=1 Tax=Benincasa hispida TaxID=102211 RepID=UPI0019009366|nr:uncharacterized protein LOC120069696 [Benincasa hispida]